MLNNIHNTRKSLVYKVVNNNTEHKHTDYWYNWKSTKTRRKAVVPSRSIIQNISYGPLASQYAWNAFIDIITFHRKMRSRVRFSINAQPRQFWQKELRLSLISSNHGAKLVIRTCPVFVHTHARTNTCTHIQTRTHLPQTSTPGYEHIHTQVHTSCWIKIHTVKHTGRI